MITLVVAHALRAPIRASERSEHGFKLLLADERNRDLLVSLLNAIRQPSRPIVSVEVVNPEIQKDAPDDRGLALDILAVHDDQTRTDVEMQAYQREAMGTRALYHWARVFRDGIGRGDDNADLHPCRVIFILAYRETGSCQGGDFTPHFEHWRQPRPTTREGKSPWPTPTSAEPPKRWST
ncbi:MAG: PD-(D/E)XK nuclease family transposase [Polyangiaceae bacterium]|nr:PD-(D/E)XK nuclease family transposase [Polyangiaceae bacterium]